MTSLAATSLYQWLMFLHVLAAMVSVGALVLLVALSTHILRTVDQEAIARFSASLRRIGPLLLAPARIAVVSLGIGLVLDSKIPAGPAQSGEFSLGRLLPTRADVDALIASAEAAGATVTAPRERPWGIYSGYFRDPDGHLWELIHNSE